MVSWEDLWEIVEKSANVLGILSFFISIPTFFFANSTRKAIRSHDDKKQYQQEIKTHIKELRTYHESISNNDVYNEAILNKLYDEMETLLIQYPTVVESFKNDIKGLKKFIIEATNRIKSDTNFNRDKITRKLHTVIQRLDKEEKS